MKNNEEVQQEIERLSIVIYQAILPAVEAISETLKKFTEGLRPLVKYQLEKNNYILMMMSEEYQTAAKHYPKLNYLALCAKKRRVRIKNIKRLYRIGCLIKKRGDFNAQ